MSEMRLEDKNGHRLYLNPEERESFLKAASLQPPKVRLFAETLHYTGCRISESLEITPARIDLSSERITLRTLKKRKSGVFRAVPVPAEYLDRLELTFGIRAAQKRATAKNELLWPFSRVRGWQIIKEIMIAADIAEGPHRSPKGLRHAYGLNAISKNVPLNMLQKWLGHSQLSTTAIYANAAGREETALASQMWD
jgi:integrase